jgi:hypothetical protein
MTDRIRDAFKVCTLDGLDEADWVPLTIDPATKYCLGAPSIPAFFAGMGGKECRSFLQDQ